MISPSQPSAATTKQNTNIPHFAKGGLGGISLLTEHLDIWTTANPEKKAGRGRSAGNAASVYGIRKLRELILELAVCGKLVPQDANDEPASELFKRIQAEKTKLIAEGKIKKDKSLPPITEEEKPFKLPHGWDWIRLNELLKKIGAGSTPLGGKQVYVTHGIPFLRSQNVWDEGLRLDDVAFISPETHQKMSGTHVFSGDLLFNITGASIGRCAIVPDSFETGNVSQHVTIVRSVSKEILQFLHLVLISKHVQKTVMDVQVGVSREGLSIGKLGQFIIPIPPLAEQHRIVAKVDELMALCDQLETQHNNATEAHEKLVSHLLGTLTQSQSAADFSVNWQRIAAHFDTLFTTEASIDALKQTLLQLAVMGKLVPQDPNDDPSSELLRRIQAEKTKFIAEGKINKDKPQEMITDEEKPFNLPQNWEWVQLQDLLDPLREISYGVIKLGTEPKTGGINTLRCSDVKPGFVDLSGVRRVSEEIEKEYIRTRLTGGEILLNIRGTLGGVALVEPNLKGFNVAREVAVIPISYALSSEYMVSVMLSIYFWDAIMDGLRGIAYKGLNLGALRLFVIPLPPISEQHRIVAKLDELMALCEQLKSRFTEANQIQKKLADVMVEQAVA